jgi:hypothetical protein
VNKEEFLDVNREGWWLVDPAADPALQQDPMRAVFSALVVMTTWSLLGLESLY